MSSRPQFSLRTLMLVTVMVCLAAATVAPLAPPPVTSPLGWKDLGIDVRIQAWLRLALCVTFPTLFTASVLARRDDFQTFFVGAVLPLMMTPLVVCCDAFEMALVPFADGRLAEAIESFEIASDGLCFRIAFLWACAPCIGLGCLISRRCFRRDEDQPALWLRDFALRLFFVVLFAAGAVSLMVTMPPSDKQTSLAAQIPVRLILCLTVPALLSVGAVDGRRSLRSFFACGLCPALIPILLVCSAEFWDSNNRGKWETFRLFEWRYLIVSAWALVPVFGLSGMFFQWLIERARSQRE